jgi:hypothetical protein
VNDRQLIGWAVERKHLQAFFSPRHWMGRLDEMKEAFGWAMEWLNEAQPVSGGQDKSIQQMFENQYKEAVILTKDIEHRKKPDVRAFLLKEIDFMPS